MRSLIKLVMATAIAMGSVIAHQQILTSRLADLNLKCDAAMDKYSEHIPHTAGPHHKALLGQMNAVNDQVSDLFQELDCELVLLGQTKVIDDQVSNLLQELGGELEWEDICLSLLFKSLGLKSTILVAEFEEFKWNNLEKERPVAGAGAEKSWNMWGWH